MFSEEINEGFTTTLKDAGFVNIIPVTDMDYFGMKGIKDVSTEDMTQSWNKFFTVEDNTKDFFIFKYVDMTVNVDISSSQVNSVNKEYLLCLPSAKYIIHTDSSVAYWQSASFLYVRGVFEDGVYDTMIRVKFDNDLGLPSSYTFNPIYSIINQKKFII